MDEIDLHLVTALRARGRQTFADLARMVGLSAPAVHDRVAKLEAAGVITGYHADIDPPAIGLGVSALVGVVESDKAPLNELARALVALDHVEACWSLAGEESYLLLVRVPDVTALEQTIGQLNRIAGVARTRTSVVLSTKKWQGRTTLS